MGQAVFWQAHRLKIYLPCVHGTMLPGERGPLSPTFRDDTSEKVAEEHLTPPRRGRYLPQAG